MLHIHHMDETQYTNYDPKLFAVLCESCHELVEKMQYRLINNPDLLSEEMRNKWWFLLKDFIIINKKGNKNGKK